MHIGVPIADRFQRVIELTSDNFIYDQNYPDLETPRTEKFVLIEILFSVGRSVKIKRNLLAHLMNGLTSVDISTNDVMVVFKETAGKTGPLQMVRSFMFNLSLTM